MRIMLALATAQQQETAAFKNWFGRSKCVDSHGRPLRVYHGTTKSSFESFMLGLNKAHGEFGIFFASDPHIASLYSGYDENFPAPEVGHVIPCYLKIDKLLTHDFKGGKEGRVEVLQEARHRGFDGVRFLNHYDAGGVQEQWVVFSAEQIKSAIGNNGKFDKLDLRMGH